MAAGMDDGDPLWEGGQGLLAADWLTWMQENAPAGGWQRATLTNRPGTTAAGGAVTTTFKHYGSLWRRNDVQWDLFLKRGHLDIFEAEASLKTHPYVKTHTVEK